MGLDFIKSWRDTYNAARAEEKRFLKLSTAVLRECVMMFSGHHFLFSTRHLAFRPQMEEVSACAVIHAGVLAPITLER